MKPGKEGYRVAVVGASSLLGKELVAILEQGKFPVSRLLTFEADEDEPELPIIDLSAASAGVVEDGQISEEELDFAFLSARLRQLPAFLSSWQQQGSAARCLVIDVVGEGLGASVDSPLAEGRHRRSGGHPLSRPPVPSGGSAFGCRAPSRFPSPCRYCHQQPAAAPGGALPAEDRRGAGFQLGIGVRLARRGRTSEADGEYPELPENSR